MVLGKRTEYNKIIENEKYKEWCQEHKNVVLSVISEKGRMLWEQVSEEFDICRVEMEDITVKNLTITPKYIKTIEMMQEGKEIYDILLELKKPKKRR